MDLLQRVLRLLALVDLPGDVPDALHDLEEPRAEVVLLLADRRGEQGRPRPYYSVLLPRPDLPDPPFDLDRPLASNLDPGSAINILVLGGG